MNGIDKEVTPWEPRRRTAVAHANFMMRMMSDLEMWGGTFVSMQARVCSCDTNQREFKEGESGKGYRLRMGREYDGTKSK